MLDYRVHQFLAGWAESEGRQRALRVAEVQSAEGCAHLMEALTHRQTPPPAIAPLLRVLLCLERQLH
jgi:hypothetical protein